MTGYNHVLNPHSKYKKELISGLVKAGPLPSYKEIVLETAEQTASEELLALLVSRDFRNVERIMSLQYKKFGPIDEELFWSLIHYIAGYPNPGARLLGLSKQRATASPLPIPEQSAYRQWRKYHKAYFHDFIEYAKSIIEPGVHAYSPSEVSDIFKAMIIHEGLNKKGWKVEIFERTNFISVARETKQIFVGPNTIRFGRERFIGLLIHEIGIHVRWAEYYGSADHPKIEEGVGTLVEQLTVTSFTPLRLYRYLAICFAVGLDGKTRDISQVYDLLMAVRSILTPEDNDTRSRYSVAKELVRVFRNLPYDIPGLVYIRDKYYFEYNMMIWKSLNQKQPSSREYQRVIAPWELEI